MRHWSSPLVGLPHVPKGRDVSGVDCWGVVVLSLRTAAGIEVPSYTDSYAGPQERREIATLAEREAHPPTWIKVESPKEFDIAMFRRGRFDSHVGVVIEPGLMLHSDTDASRVERYDNGRWALRLTGFYRHHLLA